MRFGTNFCLILLFSISSAAIGEKRENEFITLCYHDVHNKVDRDIDSDQAAVSTQHLALHFQWLKDHGYQPVSVDDILAARKGIKPLPQKAILLTFDDGYVSFYTTIYPLLKLFNYPAVYALVTSWMETPNDQMVSYGKNPVSRSRFMTWNQVREVAASGLVEIALHSHNMHLGIQGNPQGNTEPALTTLTFNIESGSYETFSDYRKRVHTDLEQGVQILTRETGSPPRVMVWPYGAHNQTTVDIARNLGMPITFTLMDGIGNPNTLDRVPRIYVQSNPSPADFVWILQEPYAKLNDPVRAVHVDMDYIYDPDPAQQDKNLSKLLDRIKDMQINTVILQAFADPDGDGVADALYFPNRHLPMRADLFNRVSWQLNTRAEVYVWAWLPVLAFSLPKTPEEWLVHEQLSTIIQVNPKRYQRLSPFHQGARQVIGEIYDDLAISSRFHGVLFHDDAVLSDWEDAGDAAMKAYQEAGLPDSITAIRNDPDSFRKWTRFKTQYLIDLTQELASRIQRFQKEKIFTARTIFAQPVLNKKSEHWFAQSMDQFLENYDYTALMAMPYMEQARNPERWLKNLADQVAQRPNGLIRTLFELQTVDWRVKQPIPSKTLKEQFRLLQSHGARNLGYYPDDFQQDHPPQKMIKQTISVRSSPFTP